tara:strand:+ start:99 stop:263 length:165 start_codon:yes stop_codon:yes gene_type:complete
MTEMLFYKLEERHYPILKPFLIQLNYLPKIIGNIDTDMIPLDNIVCSALRVVAL